ncbi:MAG: DUF1549 and DUF1553 domain-containing protein [Verrucomicrobia bacterium]|nr:DUF1549 and DUF1553 domain-containing protein [Verrucomicrobiota bacterium]
MDNHQTWNSWKRQSWQRIYVLVTSVGVWLIFLGMCLGAVPESVSDDGQRLRQTTLDLVESGRDHWAFQPLIWDLPTSSADSLSSTIDSFIEARLQAEGLESAPAADTSDLVRRLHVQLTGLPPSTEVRQAFVDHPSESALEGLVDRLLSSPQFGERWGRHWLDLARYADSNGLDENFLFREAWRYRNWVVRAMNDDMPFDRFLLEQIAGDLLSYDSIEQRDQQRIASGFLVIGPKVLLGVNPNKQRMDVADEQIDTIGRSVLGLTLGCARCHDHKFEPVPTEDYYALAGIFTSTRVMQQRHMLGQQRVMEQLVGLGEKGDELNAAYEKYWRERPKVVESKKQAESALELLEKQDEAELDNLAEKDPGALSVQSKDRSLTYEARIRFQKEWIESFANILNHPPEIPPRAMVPTDVDEPRDEAVRRAGQFDKPENQVPRGFLRVVGKEETHIPDDESGRLELARWLTDVENGAGRLTARVFANRVWHHLIGRGLVRTVDNFGRTGEQPSHPELLDYLASRLIESGWSVKSIVREIVLSRTFALSSQHDPKAHATDPDNTMLWRAHRRRLDPESLRDAMLSVAGRLDLTPMQSSVWYLGDQATAVGDNKNRRRTDFPNRSLYLPAIRNDLPEIFDVFDFADPHATTGARPQTTVAIQALYLLNDDMVMDLSKATAQRFLMEEASTRLSQLYETMFQRTAVEAELKPFQDFIMQTQKQLERDGAKNPELEAWSALCHAMFSMSRFHFLD